MVTPIEFLLGRIGGAPHWLAPERADELREITRDLNIKIEVHGGQHWFEVDTSYGQIRLNLDLLERVWCFCYGYLKIWHIQQSQKWPSGEVVKLIDYPELDLAREMLRWATEDHQGYLSTTADRLPRESREEWPDHFPVPSAEESDGDVRAANTFFVSVIAFILLHEIGHSVGKHTIVEEGTGEERALSGVEMEYEADDFAADFLLREWQRDKRENMFVQRSVAIVTGLSLQASLEPYRKLGKQRSHPCTPDRFLHFWTKFAAPQIPNKIPVAPIADAFHLILGLHALNAEKGQPPKAELGATYQTVEEYLKAVRPLFGCPD